MPEKHGTVRTHADHRRRRRESVSYLEGCTAPMRDENQLHAAVVELVAMDDAQASNTAPCRTGIRATRKAKAASYNFVTKRGACRGARTVQDQLDAGGNRQRDHLEISVLHPAGRWQHRRILFGGADQQPPAADTGTKMIHIGKNTTSTIVSKGISAGQRATTPIAAWCAFCQRGSRRAELHAMRQPADRRSMRCAHRALYREPQCHRRNVEHEATTSKIAEDQLFYCRQRGLSPGRRGRHDRQRLLPRSVSKSCRWSLPLKRRKFGG